MKELVNRGTHDIQEPRSPIEGFREIRKSSSRTTVVWWVYGSMKKITLTAILKQSTGLKGVL